jgi:hypothetical protein
MLTVRVAARARALRIAATANWRLAATERLDQGLHVDLLARGENRSVRVLENRLQLMRRDRRRGVHRVRSGRAGSGY